MDFKLCLVLASVLNWEDESAALRTWHLHFVGQPWMLPFYPSRLMVVLESASSVFSPWNNKRLKHLGLQGWGILCEQVKHGPSPEEEPVYLTQTCLPSLSNPSPQPASPEPAPLSSLFEISHVPVHGLVLFELASRLLLFLHLAYCVQFCCCSPLETHWPPWQPPWILVSTSVYASHPLLGGTGCDSSTSCMPGTLQTLSWRHHLVYVSQQSSRGNYCQLYLVEKFWKEFYPLCCYGVEILDSVIFLQRGLIYSVVAVACLRFQLPLVSGSSNLCSILFFL